MVSLIYTVDREITTRKRWKQEAKEAIDSHVHLQWISDLKKSLKCLNIESLRVGKTHPTFSTLSNDVRNVRKAYTTTAKCIQENRANSNPHAVDDNCTLCLQVQGHWWGFISRNYVIWPTFLLTNVFIALKGSHFWFLFDFTAAGVVPCGGRKKSPRTSTIVQFFILFWSVEISDNILRNQK